MTFLSRHNIPRSHATVLIVAVVLHLLHQLWFYEWFIEDAAITFSFSKYWVQGEGLVPFPGAERVEGYSNPTWMVLIAAWYAAGVDPFVSSKIMAAFFGAACLPMAWLLAREAMPGDNSPAPLAAPLILAFSAHHAIWSASALENSLYNLLILTGSYLVLQEQKSARYPWSAVAFLLLAMTRPDGLMYAAIGGFFAMVFTLRAGRGWRPTILWLLTFWLPYLAFIALRLWYFAWPLPSTFYAKTATRDTWLNMYKWYARGWNQVKLYCQGTWTGFFLPLFVMGMLGTRGLRGKVTVAIVTLGAALLLSPGPDVLRNRWFWPQIIPMDNEVIYLPYLRIRLGFLVIFLLLLPILVIGRRGWRARLLVYVMALASLFFQVFTDGDWMQGLRWFSMLAPTQAILFCLGIDELSRAVTRRFGQHRWQSAGWLVFTLAICLWVPPNVTYSVNYENRPDDWPGMIHQRVKHKEKIVRTVFLEEQPRTLDMDMGAHMYWSEMEMIDMAGLINTPVAMHTYWDRPFVEEYIFGEKKPHFGHVHLRWAEISKFKTYPYWDENYIEYKGYAQGPWLHGGMWARRDLFVQPRWDGSEDRAVTFPDGISLAGWKIPSPEAGRGRALFIETAWKTRPRTAQEGFLVTMTLSNDDGELASWDLPMGYTVWGYPLYPIYQWKADEVFVGRYAVNLLPELPEGTYDLGFSVRNTSGQVIPAGGPLGTLAIPANTRVGGRDDVPAHFANGEIRFPGAVTIIGKSQVDRYAEEDREAALRAAADDNCEEAKDRWLLARRHIPLHENYKRRHQPKMNSALAACWSRRAQAEPDQALPHLVKAKSFDHRNQTFIAVRQPLADKLYAEGLEARSDENWEVAFARFNDVLSIDASRAWARRYTEEARDHRLGLPIVPPHRKKRQKTPNDPKTGPDADGPRDEAPKG
jgi:hypothetical protein